MKTRTLPTALAIATALAVSPTLAAPAAAETIPVTSAPVDVREVGLYLYQKTDTALPASWPNSGPQSFIAAQAGTEWFTAYPGTLPAHVCGEGWAVQMDEIVHDGTFVWPSTITYPDNVLSKAGVLVDAIHVDLETLIDVPSCTLDPEPTPDPTPTPTPTPDPTPSTPAQPTLPALGPEEWWPALLAGALAAVVAGTVLLGLRRKSTRA